MWKIDHGGGGRGRCLFGGGRIRGTDSQEKSAAEDEAGCQSQFRQVGRDAS